MTGHTETKDSTRSEEIVKSSDGDRACTSYVSGESTPTKDESMVVYESEDNAISLVEQMEIDNEVISRQDHQTKEDQVTVEKIRLQELNSGTILLSSDDTDPNAYREPFKPKCVNNIVVVNDDVDFERYIRCREALLFVL